MLFINQQVSHSKRIFCRTFWAFVESTSRTTQNYLKHMLTLCAIRYIFSFAEDLSAASKMNRPLYPKKAPPTSSNLAARLMRRFEVPLRQNDWLPRRSATETINALLIGHHQFTWYNIYTWASEEGFMGGKALLDFGVWYFLINFSVEIFFPYSRLANYNFTTAGTFG